jgi:sterol desaturase/sphingolipid hydroxylase (fatty acid hydroxylase superfamily)
MLLLAPATFTFTLLELGVAAPLALTVVVVGLIAGVALLETIAPFRAAWLLGQRLELADDLAYIALASVPDRAARIAVEAGTVMVVASVGATAGILSDAPKWLQVAGALGAFVLSDLGKYAMHRASHAHPGLWRFHMAHHQPTRLTVLNALRLHPINMAYNAAIDTLPLVVLGLGPGVAAVLATVRATVGVLQHANLHLDEGKQWLVNAPSYHRTHHDTEASSANHNFGSTLLVWDRLFGTLRRAEAPLTVGVAPASHRLPVGYLGQLLYPFCGEALTTTCGAARWSWLVR